ncbi:hypothetical protein [Idiomarina ramblicola]|uniref:Uncharacterized protein n=1 Tax=Idiomarina ramblicola TaxID=263724 RepID=A0A432Z6C0_9GAMM|nr:hypothetical protein [Idiomarina ramblicola]RUO73442.1 hypothetical protein CWI78_03155 [Idiomarina ramblicola]
MALLSISIGSIFFLAAITWVVFVAVNDQNGSPAFGFMLALFPMILSLILVVPSTLYRAVFVVKSRPRQTTREKVILAAGIVITVLFIGAVIKLVFA